MMVVSREVGQGIRLEVPGHGEVYVFVSRIVNESAVYLEIEAARTLPIDRGEVWEAIRNHELMEPRSTESLSAMPLYATGICVKLDEQLRILGIETVGDLASHLAADSEELSGLSVELKRELTKLKKALQSRGLQGLG